MARGKQFRWKFLIDADSNSGVKAVRRVKEEIDGLDGAEKRNAKTKKELKRQTDSLFQSVKRLIGPLALGAAGSLFLRNTIKTTAEFTKAISNLSAITGATGKDLEFYKDQAKEIGRTTSLSAKQAAEGFKLIASAKPDLLASAKDLAAVTKEAVTLAEATGSTLPQAAQALGAAMNQFQLPATDASRVINALAASSQLGTAEVASVTEAMVNAGAVANTLGLSFEETIAGIQGMAAAGIDGARAGTALRQVLLKLEKTGDKNLQPSLVGLSTALENLGELNLSTTQLMDIFGEEAAAAAASLLTQRDAVAKLATEIVGTNTAVEQAATNMDNLSGDALKAKSATEALMIELGELADPGLRESTQLYTETIASLADNLGDVGPAAHAMAQQFAIVFGDLNTSSQGLFESIAFGFEKGFETSTNSLKAFQWAFLDTFGIAGDKGIGTIQSIVRAWSIGFTNIIAGTKNFGVQVGSTLDKFKLFFGASNMSALEFAETLAGINMATEGAQQQIQDQANATFELLDQLRDELIASREAAEEFASGTEQMTHMTEGFVGPVREAAEAVSQLTEEQTKAREKADDLIASLNQQITALGMTARSAAIYNSVMSLGAEVTDEKIAEVATLTANLFDLVAAQDAATAATKAAAREETEHEKAMARLTKEGTLQTNMVENLQRELANLIDEFIRGEPNVKGFFDAIARGLSRTASESISKTILESVGLGGGGGGGTGSAGGGGFGLPGIISGTAIGSQFLKNSGIGGNVLQGPTQDGSQLVGATDFKQIGLNLAASAVGDFVGTKFGEAIFDKEAESNIATTIGTVIGTTVGGPIGAFIGSSIGALVDTAAGGDGFTNSMAGMLVAPTPGANPAGLFDVEAFASGFQPVGFADRRTREEALAIIEPFRGLDAIVDELVESLGGNLDAMRQATLAGVGVEGRIGTDGTFLGMGGRTENLGAQLDLFARQLARHVSGLSQDVMDDLAAARTAEEIVSILSQAQESAEDLGGSTEELAQMEDLLAKIRQESTRQIVASMAHLGNAMDDLTNLQRQLENDMFFAQGISTLHRSAIPIGADAAYADQIAAIDAQRQALLSQHAEQLAHERELHAERVRAYREQLQLASRLNDTVFGILGGSNSPLSNQQQFEMFGSEFNRLAGLAEGGDMEAAGKVSQVADTYVQAIRDRFASSHQGDILVEQVVSRLTGIQGAFASAEDPGEFSTGSANQALLSGLQGLQQQISRVHDAIATDAVNQLVQLNRNVIALSDQSATAENLPDVLADVVSQQISAGLPTTVAADQIAQSPVLVDAANEYLANNGGGLVSDFTSKRNPLATSDLIQEFADQVIAKHGGVNDAAASEFIETALANGVGSKQVAAALGLGQTDVINLAKRLGFPEFAEGGMAVGPQSGYPVMLHGPELITPMNGTGGLKDMVRVIQTGLSDLSKRLERIEQIHMAGYDHASAQRIDTNKTLEKVARGGAETVGSARYAKSA